ncbi:MAG: aminotransferase class I/II-fold pyridoxal phosphate-dependent enzyme [Christensenellales bacterium]|jgi:arginine decarboxylase
MPSLYDQLNNALPGMLPMHMPGHKRNTLLAPYLKGLSAHLDITEIDGFDNLHAPRDMLRQSMALAARLFGAARTYYLVNGSTVGILAGIRALTKHGDTVVMARNCHISAFHAVSLCGLRPVFITPPVDPATGACASVCADDVGAALDRHSGTPLVVLTSPTYEGVLSDMPAICRAAHARGARVLADEAHGAHLDFSPFFTGGAVRAGADAMVQSLHKTLPSLTQTAVLHIRDETLATAVEEQLYVFQTTSPSYLLLASIDSCVQLLAEEGGALFARWHEALASFQEKVSGLQHLRLVKGVAPPAVYARDPSKLYISCRGTDHTGPQLAARLRQHHGIEIEMAQPDGLLAMTGLGDTQESLARFANALIEADSAVRHSRTSRQAPLPPPPPAPLPPHEAEQAPWHVVPLRQAAGRTAAEYVTVYPPGVPLLIPGEEITRSAADFLLQAAQAGISMLKRRSLDAADTIAVLC